VSTNKTAPRNRRAASSSPRVQDAKPRGDTRDGPSRSTAARRKPSGSAQRPSRGLRRPASPPQDDPVPVVVAIAEKLQKVLARAGIGSRREMERWIEEGRVNVDGAPASLGQRVLPGQDIQVDGQSLSAGAAHGSARRILIYRKPEGEMCTTVDPEGRPTIYDHLPRLRHGRWIAVGRLDFNTQGLLLLTTDGELANRLMHPSSEIDREYAVRVLGNAEKEVLDRLRLGIDLEDGLAKFDTLVDVGGEGANHWYHVTLKEGRNREVRRLWEAVGLKVSRLIRVRYGMVTLPRGLRPGRWQEMDPKTAKQLLKLVNMEVEAPEPAPTRGRAPLPGSAHAARKAATKQRISRPPRTARLPARTAKQAKRKV
jgi:23S rRNA pseudouridine2605 synthase